MMDQFLNGPLVDVPLGLCSQGMSVEFAIGIAQLCEEIRQFYGIEENVRIPNNENLLEFLYDLSAFLFELECPYEELSCGDILIRFQTSEKCEQLLKFLVAELKAARLFGLKKLQNHTSEQKDLELTPDIDAAMKVLKIPKQSGSTDEWRVLETLTQKVDQKISQCQRQPLFLASLDEKSLAEIGNLCQSFSRDFNNRLLLLTRRLKVTIESFLWCDRVSSRKEEIRNILTESLKSFENVKSNCDISHILSASTSLTFIAKASEKHTKSKAHPLSLGEAPKDRGGRTNEMMGVKNETFRSQNHGGGNRGGRGNHRGGGNRGRGGGNQQQSQEQAVLQQYTKNHNRQ